MEFMCCLIFYTLSIVSVTLHTANGLSITATASETDVGGSATFRCDTTINAPEIGTTLSIRRGSTELMTSVIVSPVRVTKNPNSTDSRFSYNSATQTMTITDVQCADETDGPFICELQGFRVDGNSQTLRDPSSVIVRVQPKAPDPLTTTPGNLISGIVEGSTLSAVCNANTGRPNKGHIRWRIHRGNAQDDVSSDDSRITEAGVGLESNDLLCTQRSESTLVFGAVNRTDQDLVVTCFVLNDDFQTSLPAACGNTTDDLCQQSVTVKILYGVSKPTIDAPETVYEGNRVELTCQATGYPEPTFRWYKGEVERGNATEIGTGRTYVFTNAAAATHDGIYSCVAMNSINGDVRNMSASETISVLVKPTTPETTQPPTDATDPPTADPKPNTAGNDDDATTIIVIVVVVVVVAVIVVAVVIYCLKCRRTKEVIEEPPEKPYYNNRQNMAFQSSQPDLVSMDGKKPTSPSLNNSFDMNTEDALRYADLTYDNRPRSRKPMAIGDTSSEYSDVQMPQV